MNATAPAGQWHPPNQLQASQAEAPVWRYSAGGSYAFADGTKVLAVVTRFGTGANERWMLNISGFRWLVGRSTDGAGRWRGIKQEDDGAYATGKIFMTGGGARLEAEDIIAAAKEWVA